MRHERGGDATVTRGGRTGVCLADEVNGHTIRIHRPVPAIVESGVQHLDGCVVIGSIVHDDDAFGRTVWATRRRRALPPASGRWRAIPG